MRTINKLIIIGATLCCIPNSGGAELAVASLINTPRYDENNSHLVGKKRILYYVCDKFDHHLKKLTRNIKNIPDFMRIRANVSTDHNKIAYKYLKTVKNLITSELCRAFGKINPYKSFQYGINKLLKGEEDDTDMGYKAINECSISELNYYILCNYLDMAINILDDERRNDTKTVLYNIVQDLTNELNLSEEMKNRLEESSDQIQKYIEIFKIDTFIASSIKDIRLIQDTNDDQITDEFLKKYQLKRRDGVHYGIRNHGSTCNMVSFLTMLKASKNIVKELRAYKADKAEKNKLDLLDPNIALLDLFDAMDKAIITNEGNQSAQIGKVEVDNCSKFKKFVILMNGYTPYGYDIRTGEEQGEKQWVEITRDLYNMSQTYDIDEVEKIFIKNITKHDLGNNLGGYSINELIINGKTALSATAMLREDIKKMQKTSISITDKQKIKDTIKKLKNWKSNMLMNITNNSPVTKAMSVVRKEVTCCYDAESEQYRHDIEENVDQMNPKELIDYGTRCIQSREIGVSVDIKDEDDSLQDKLKSKDAIYKGQYIFDKLQLKKKECEQCSKGAGKQEQTYQVTTEPCNAAQVLIIHRTATNDIDEMTGQLAQPSYRINDETGIPEAEHTPKKVRAEKYVEFNGCQYIRRAGIINTGDHFVCIYTGDDGTEYYQSDDLVAKAKQRKDKVYKYVNLKKFSSPDKLTEASYIRYINSWNTKNADDLYSLCDCWLYDKVTW